MSKFSQFLHSAGGNSLFSFLASFLSEAIEANNPAYTPLIAPVATAIQAELGSLAAGNAPTPHSGDGTAVSTEPLVNSTPTAATVTTTTEVKAS